MIPTPLTDAVALRLPQNQVRFVDQLESIEQYNDLLSLARRMERDRAELIEALNGVMGLVQLIGHGDGTDHTKNHRYVDADKLLAKVKP